MQREPIPGAEVRNKLLPQMSGLKPGSISEASGWLNFEDSGAWVPRLGVGTLRTGRCLVGDGLQFVGVLP